MVLFSSTFSLFTQLRDQLSAYQMSNSGFFHASMHITTTKIVIIKLRHNRSA